MIYKMTVATIGISSVAKNKRDIELRVKREELDQAAARLFLENGYEATSMARIAQALEVAPNTLYWYYPSKDELLVGVLNHLLSKSLQQLPSISRLPLQEQMEWVLGNFEQLKSLVTTVHARLEQSEVIRGWHERFHQLLESGVIYSLMGKGISRERAAMLAAVATFLVEGLLVHPHSGQERRDILNWFASSVAER